MRLFWAAVLSCLSYVESHYVNLTHDGPVVTGATVTLVATLYEDDGSTPDGKFLFEWEDNDVPMHKAQFGGNITKSTWSVNYNASGPGRYEVWVRVSLFTISWWRIASMQTVVNVTPFLNGVIKFYQNNTAMENYFVSSSHLVDHRIVLTKPDLEFITNSYDKIQSYWFLNYSYMGSTSGLNYTYNYTKFLDKEVTVKAYVMASLPKNHSVPVITTTTVAPHDNINFTGETTTVEPVTVTPGTTQRPITPVPPDFNLNSTCTPPDPNSPYGCFQQDVSVRAEVKDVQVAGNYWLRHGDMLNLSVSCTGSPPYWHCIKILTGEYNTTGKENCLKATQTQHCSVKVLHYFSEANEYTLLFIIGNQISRTVTPVRITIYRVQKHAQLSVIIVPVACSIVAVILIVFGVAYYIQSRNRYIVEVADFDFAQPSCDTEYKTLGERLRDAVSGAINRTQDWSQEDSGGGPNVTGSTVWSPSRKYGSMQ